MNGADRWTEMYSQVPLHDVPRHYAGMSSSPFLMQYLTVVLLLCPVGGTTCEIGVGSGYGPVWLSRRGIQACGIDYSPLTVERASQVNHVLGGLAKFSTGDLFDLYDGETRYAAIHHQGVLEHFTVPQIRAALAQQVASADWVVFSVPSVNYPFEAEFGDEQFLALEEWKRIVEPFTIEELEYYGDPQNVEKEHILCVLKGQKATDELRAMMSVPQEPLMVAGRMEALRSRNPRAHPAAPTTIASPVQRKPTRRMRHKTNPEPRRLPTISLCMIARDEEKVIGDCLRSIRPWVDEVILVDTGSTDRTVEIAESFGACVYHILWCDDFSAARNVSLQHATSEWTLWMDAGDTIPELCASKLKDLALIADCNTLGFMMQVQIPAAPGETGFTKVDHVKLFRNLPQLRFEGRIHEQILESIHRAGGVIERSDLYVVHSSYDYSLEG